VSKDRILFSVVGALLGFVVGFMFANNVNRAGLADEHAGHDHSQQEQMQGLPPDHPPVDMSAMQPKVDEAALTAAVAEADKEADNFEAQAGAASILYQARRYDEALKYLARANNLRPADYEIIVGLGNINFDAEKFVEAEKWYAAALKTKPDDVNVRTDMGLTFMFRAPADYKRAIAEFKRSLELNPTHAQTLQNLTVAYTRSGDAANARETLTKLEAAHPKSVSVARLRAEIDELGAPGQQSPANGAKSD
jgi:tetratricopeptide (TPR) repeat protein